ncbi:MAG: sacsin N-terminal ATP-binding-like domain-containing protein [Bernardetiaceae bacterium]
MKHKNFIDDLSQNNANYNNPEQAITTANLCETISKDINTDSQRFLYELLQNADDASNQSEMLDVRIDFMGDYVAISHKGEPFSEIDIESISSAGDGTKAGDSNKTGFKGIGFKSVFSHSNFVIIKSGNFCFKFDKQYWSNHWNSAWSSQSVWKAERKGKNKDESLKMPWQIIPIWTELPNELKSLSIFQEYNVSTIIRYDKIEQLKGALNDLFSKSQIVLFLRSKQVKISINTNKIITLEKVVSGEKTILKRNGDILSEWLIKTEQFSIPSDVQTKINEDDKSPKKLKEAKQTEISFAVQVENGKLKAVDKANRLIFTYLPTSINYDFPFLVNASFLTDAGRQHLHQDTFWNNWLFKQIPIKFFSWVAELAHKKSKYNKQFLTVVPHKLGGSLLESSFNKGFNTALQTIAFVPNLKGDLLKVKESVFDKTNISQFINPQTLINYINKSRSKSFSVSSYTPYLEPLSTLGRLGTEMFDIDDLERFFASSIFAEEHKLNENFNLISFLHEQAQRSKGDDSRRNAWNEILRQTPFIFDENQQLKKPSHIYFPAVEFSNEFSDKISIINKNIVSKINANSRIKNWLEYLGVKEPSDLSFIEKTIIEQGETFVTKGNAIEIGRYLFNAHKKGVLQDNHYEKLKNLKVLTKQSSLISASKSFLSDYYEPDLRIESVYDNDIFVSKKYFESKDLKSEWKTFFIRIGVKNQLNWESFTVSKITCKFRRDFEYFKPIISLMDGNSKYSNFGQYNYSINEFTLHHFSFIDYVNNYHFAKIYWENVFKLAFEANSYDRINGSSGLWPIYHGVVETANQKRYFIWTIENLALFPTRNGQLKKVNEILINSPENIEIASKFLSVLDYSGTLPENWLKILPIKQTLDLDDLLKILELIWKQNNSDEVSLKENQKITNKVYERLSTNHLGYSDKLRNWAGSNKLLAKNGIDFYYPKDLSIVTVEGFRASHLAFAEKQSPEIIELLRHFGVKIIDKVNATISNSKVEITDLKTKLLQTSPLIALVTVEKSKNRKEWKNEYERIKQKLSAIHFFETTEIYLSYGNEDDKQRRSSWAEHDNFYYVGKWYSPRVLDGLVEPLGSFLKIRYAERILTVLLLETFAGGIEYLKEKGFDISLIPDDLLNQTKSEFVPPTTSGNTNPDVEDFLRDLGRQGELLVFKKLKQIYTQKYNEVISETKTGFKVGDAVEVFWKNISEDTTADHDFKVVELNKEIYIDSKATTYGKNVEKLALYISGNELNLMENADKYLIARVYNATSENPIVEFVRLKIDSVTD